MKFKPRVDELAARDLLGEQGLLILEASPHSGLIRLQVTPGDESQAIAELLASGEVAIASLNHILHASVEPDDTYYAWQWAPPKIEAPAAWDLTTGIASVTVAMVDSGLDTAHGEFAGRVVFPRDEIDDDYTPQDTCSHGTHVAGIVGARGNNAAGVAGMAWEVNLLPVRVLIWDGDLGRCVGTEADIHDGIYWAVAHGAKIVNLSLGGLPFYGHTCEQDYPVMSSAVQYASDTGVLVVASSGNNYASRLACPALQSAVMAVGATTVSDERSVFSNYGTGLEVVAPGSSIYSTVPGNYGDKSGTSMAAPHVSGLGALLWSLSPGLSREQVRSTIQSSVVDLGTPGWDKFYGYGRINAWRALTSGTADLSVTKTAWPELARVNQSLTYTITVRNAGPVTATTVTMVDTLPDAVAFDSAPPDCAYAGGTVTCTLANLASSSSAVFDVAVTPLPAAVGTITNTVGVSAAERDLVPGNNSDSVAVSIDPAEVLSITQTVHPDPAWVKQPLTYTVVARNRRAEGGADMVNVVVTDTLPASVGFGAATSNRGDVCSHSGEPSGGTVTCHVGTLGAAGNATQTATIAIVVTPTRPGPIINTAWVGSDQPGGSVASTTLTTSVKTGFHFPVMLRNMVTAPDLVVDELVASSQAVTVTIRNTGGAPVTDAFWVEVFFDPTTTPGLNIPWPLIAAEGGVWGVTAPVYSGTALTLVTGGDFYFAQYSHSAPFPADAVVYALVDAIDFSTSYGAVRESEEANNLFGPVISTFGLAGGWVTDASEVDLPQPQGDLPAR